MRKHEIRLIVVPIFLLGLSLLMLQTAYAGDDMKPRGPAVDWKAWAPELNSWEPPKYIPGWGGVPADIVLTSQMAGPPPQEPVRWTAQWEQREGVLLAWPLYWSSVDTAYCSMVDELQDVGIVYLLHDSVQSQRRIARKLLSNGIPLTNVEWLPIPYDTNWTRDYGPQNIWGQTSGNWGIVDNVCIYGPDDNNVNPNLHNLWNMDYYESPIVTEGGNLCTDGMGKVFCTSWVRAENFFMSPMQLHQAFWVYFRARLTILPWPPVSPHLDMCAKLVDPETWIVGEWPSSDPNTPVMDQLVGRLQSMTASTGNPYTIHRITQPDQLPGGYWRTYTNAYMQNGKVLVPTFNVPQDQAALAVFQQALPGWEIVGIDCTGYDGSGGAIHCSTHGIALHE